MTNGMSRAGRRLQIVQLVGENPGISTRALAKQMKMAYGTHFRQLVREVYEDGLIWHCDGKKVANRLANNWYPPLWTE